jgi:cytochrome P450
MSMDELLSQYDQYNAEHTCKMYEVFAYAREKCPIFWANAAPGYWIVSRYEDAKKVLYDTVTFSNRDGVTIHGNGSLPALPAATDPPEHTVYRNLLKPELFSIGVCPKLKR